MADFARPWDPVEWSKKVITHLEASRRTVEALADHIAIDRSREQRAAAVARQDKEVEMIATLTREEFAQGSAYTNIVMTVGYAGLFALWSMVKTEPHPLLIAISGLSICLSLVFFVGWELFASVKRSLHLRGFVKDLQAGTATLDGYRAAKRQLGQDVVRVWPYAFIPAAGFAALAAVSLLWICAASMARAAVA